MITKSEQLERIKKLENKALKLFRNGEDGKEVNKLLEEVIRLENLYEKRYGRNPSKQYGQRSSKQ